MRTTDIHEHPGGTEHSRAFEALARSSHIFVSLTRSPPLFPAKVTDIRTAVFIVPHDFSHRSSLRLNGTPHNMFYHSVDELLALDNTK